MKKELTDRIFVTIIASDYFNAYYNDRTGGPIINALARMGYNTKGAEGDEEMLKLEDTIYLHLPYSEADFLMDRRLAQKHYYKQDTFVRSMILTKEGIKSKSDYLDSYSEKFKKSDWLQVIAAIALFISTMCLAYFVRNFILN